MITDVQRTVGMIEVKATKAADLVESVHPDKLMIQVQKEDGKIEGLRGMLEAKEEMMKNIMEQLRDMKKDGIVAHTAGQSYSLIALSATNNLRRCGVTAPTVGNPNRKINVFPFG